MKSDIAKPKEAFEQLEDEHAARQHFCHIRIQQRTGRKAITTVQGVGTEHDLKRIVRFLKKKYKVMQLSGDQRQQIKDFLVDVGIVKENCKVHRF
ncbi:unnamed protein product [Heligmosomoides polygyrus]|uniref:SUI1 domain-containing protein n=1 Tax=Heligmosomoides polygyrus TaxID=6339 RepID=A0A183FHN1_HELPZ|nr:unnamed protein product [Heligmosomoides polygyrus]